MEQQFEVIYYCGGDSIGTSSVRASDRATAHQLARQLFPRCKVGVINPQHDPRRSEPQI